MISGESSDGPFADLLVLVVFVVVPLAVLACGLVTAAKGRWGWVAAGVLTAGVLWPVGVFLVARPDSLWARRVYGPRKLAAAERAFPHRSGLDAS